MNKIQKVSLASAVGGSLLIADNLLHKPNGVWAASQLMPDNAELEKRSAVLFIVMTLLLDDEAAKDDDYVAELNTLLTVDALQGVLNNDRQTDISTLTLLENTQYGLLDLATDGSFTYLPNIDFSGFDQFRYLLTYSNGETDDAMVNIRVNAQPIAVDLSLIHI